MSGLDLKSQATRSFNFDYPESKSVSFPFELVNNLMIIPVQVNGSGVLQFILDTGLRTTLVTEIPSGQSVRFNYARKLTIRGFGEGDDLEVWQSHDNLLRLPRIEAKNQTVYVLTHDKFHLSSQLGMDVHGLIGADLFKEFVVEIDYWRKVIIFHSPEHFSIDKFRYRKFRHIPLIFHKNKPYIAVTIEMNDSTSLVANVLIDSGSSDALWLFESTHESIQHPAKSIFTFLGQGLNGDIFGYHSRIKSIDLAGFVLDKPTTAFPDSAFIQKSLDLELKGRNGSIGASILNRFTVILDYKHSSMYIRPNSNFRNKFYYDMSGIELRMPYAGMPVYKVHAIRKDSPADRAGVQEGDQVMAINNVLSVSYTMNDIIALFQSRAGRTIKMRLSREGEMIIVKFKLESTI